ncbi:MAG: hypothetical protein KGK01_09865 [Bradyrhizobium sp.]|uniref:permease prefix domain 2-containing transporter n=1 Tax=Bradyrhizobium sp. TaxID=376 RepID=UPI001C28D9A0|nr:permease prefix domain 2-containing transporter [Bradyrhizobium sp.]MBU6464091.1 hypothetical protein [Pseudomonadota bacterium]MDE2069138.1 hypothetical protein [Bradyrhizobium sp.]MDE2242724.1 hypothetical protein [Bradyrhizobium sp.]MDE2467174.1 hypothetical protein [Bradyrhizobium sp.]
MKDYDWMAHEIGQNIVEVTMRFDEESRRFLVRDLPDDRLERALRIQAAIRAATHEHELKQSRADLMACIEELTLNAEKLLGEKEAKPSPPRIAQLCMSLLAPKKSAQALLGDLLETFHKNADRFGEKEARRMYWFEVVSSAGPWIKRLFFAVVVDYVRSKFGL